MSTLQIQLVKKTAIIESGDFNLSAARYLEKVEINSVYEVVSIIDTFQLVKQSNKIKKNNYLKEGMIPIIDQSSDFIAGYTNDENGVIDEVCPLIIFGDHSRVVKFINFKFLPGADGVKILKPNIDMILPKFLYNILKSIKLKNLGYSRHFKLLKEVMIPLPPLEIQEQIVKEIEGYQQIIDGCRQVVENYKPVIDIDPNWEITELGQMAILSTGRLNANAAKQNGLYPFFTCSKEISKINEYAYDQECILLSGNNAAGNYDVKYYKGKFNAYQRVYIISLNNDFKTKVDYQMLYFSINQQLNLLKSLSVGSVTKYLTLPVVKSIKVPLPKIETQKEIVEKLKQEREVIEGNKELIKIYEKKINDKIKELF